jgi:hypothetical protein
MISIFVVFAVIAIVAIIAAAACALDLPLMSGPAIAPPWQPPSLDELRRGYAAEQERFNRDLPCPEAEVQVAALLNRIRSGLSSRPSKKEKE